MNSNQLMNVRIFYSYTELTNLLNAAKEINKKKDDIEKRVTNCISFVILAE